MNTKLCIAVWSSTDQTYKYLVRPVENTNMQSIHADTTLYLSYYAPQVTQAAVNTTTTYAHVLRIKQATLIGVKHKY